MDFRVRDLDFTESYCRRLSEDEFLDEFYMPIKDQPWSDSIYAGINSWGNHVFTPSDDKLYREDDGIRSCEWASKGDIIRPRNTLISLIVKSVVALQCDVFVSPLVPVEIPHLSEVLSVDKMWFWRVKFIRILV